MIGTKSVLYGAHCFLIHPLFVALAWLKLYGLKRVRDPYLGKVTILDPRLWVVFFLHDLGYWGCPNMDGEEGERHPYWAAHLVSSWFGLKWGQFALYHSRFLAKRNRQPFSLLCVADKLSVALEPWWLYLPRVMATGEIHEYMALAGGKDGSKYKGEPNTKYESMQLETGTVRGWHRTMTSYLERWAETHKHGAADTWTPEQAA